jgi:DNA modification methylase
MIPRSTVRLQWSGKNSDPPASPVHLAPRHAGTRDLRLVHGDNLAALRALERTDRAAAALVYLDPPFLTGRQHAMVRRRRDAAGTIVREMAQGFDDRWTGLEAYLDALGPRVRAARELLLPGGCLVLHVDPKTSHYVKVLCDEIFGPDSFASEIIWRYRRWPAKTPNFQRLHDVLLRYVKDPAAPPRFVQLYEPLAASTRATWGDRKQRAVLDASGRRARSSKTPEASPGAPLGDVWEIGIVAPVSRERTGYPTQKPEALLQRLLAACTHPGDLVVDPYSGSGTTLAVCARLGRRAIGIDDNAVAIETARQRLAGLGVTPLTECVVTALRSTRRASGRRSSAA